MRTGNAVILVFSGAASAGRVVAGLPAAARALRDVALAGADRCIIAVPGGWTPEPRARAELVRLARGIAYTITDTSALPAGDEPQLLLQGERLVGPERLRLALAGLVAGGPLLVAPPRDWTRLPPLSPEQAERALDRAGRAILAATAKPTDGIVSQLINRPISQAISRQLLRFVGVSPFVATLATALLALAMLAALTFGGAGGLVAGAVFFQLASIVDGVDGEIARATFRSSKAGAMADSLVDALTNIGFLAGLDINLWIQGNARAAIAGSAGLAIVALGLFLIGRRARRTTDTFTFDGVKTHFQQRRSWLFQMLIWLTMRDFFAFAWLVGALAGVASGGVVLFSFGAAVWLIVVLFVLRPQPT